MPGAPPSPYALRGGAAGRERLRVLARVTSPGTEALFDRLGVGAGWTCLDAGCGGGDVTRALARRAGPTGRVLGTDVDAEKLDIARQEAAAEGLGNVRFEVRAVADAPEEAFDLVYARFLLSHIADPAAAARALFDATRPGGVVAVEDVDFAGHFVWPPSEAFARYLVLYEHAVRRRGGDPALGPRLPGLLQGAGFEAVEAAVAQPIALQGEAKRLNPLTMASIADAVIADGLATRAETDALVAALDAYAADPGTLAGLPRIVQTWGRRPL